MKTLNPEEFSKADLIRHALRQKIDATRTEVGTLYGDEEFFSTSHFSTIKKEVTQESLEQKQLKLFEKQEKKKTEEQKEKKEPKKNGVSIEALQLENSYLRWQLEGERQGFFDRWLEERDE